MAFGDIALGDIAFGDMASSEEIAFSGIALDDMVDAMVACLPRGKPPKVCVLLVLEILGGLSSEAWGADWLSLLSPPVEVTGGGAIAEYCGL